MAARMLIIRLVTILGLATTPISGSGPFDGEIADSVAEEQSCFPAIFSFGSSVADTGKDVLTRTNSNAESLPYGMTYFNTSSKRWSNGRLVIDFWAQAFRLPLLHPSIKVVGSSFRQRANFAAAGATAVNTTSPLNSPFYLAVQLHQFRTFRRAVLVEYQEGDIFISLMSELYEEGARNILVEDVYPVGCTAKVLTVYVPSYGEQAPPDSSGCSEFFNVVAKMHNLFLKQEIEALAEKLPDLSIAFVDTYSTRYGMMTNPRKYGFTEGIRACCGIGGEYNYDPKRSCATEYSENGKRKQVQACANVSGHVAWDGVHYTEAANRILMESLLSGNHFYPMFKIKRDSCSLAEV